MAPGSILHHISFQSTLFCYLLLSIYIIKIPQIFILSFLSLSDLTFASGREGIDNPLSRWLRGSCLFVQVLGTCVLPPTGLIPWFSKTEGNTYATLLHHPFLFKEKPTQCSRGSKKDFWRRCRGVYAQVKTYKYPSQTLIPRITLFAICLSFSSPPLHLCRFIRPLFPFASFSLASYVLVCWIVCHDG